MRILLLNHAFSGGGAERCVRDLYHGLRARGHEVHALVANPTEGLPEDVQSICRPWERCLRPLDMLADWTDWRHRGSIQKLSQITPQKFDLVHLHHVGGGWLSLRALQQLCGRIPSVWTHHDEWAVTDGFICDLTGRISKEEVFQQSSGLYRLLRRSPYHRNFKNSRVGKLLNRLVPSQPWMIAPSLHILNLLNHCDRFTSSRKMHLYHGLSMLHEPARTMDRSEARQKWGIPADRAVILMAAAHLHDVHKGIAMGLEAIRQVKPADKLHLFLLGKNGDSLRRHLPFSHVTAAYAPDNQTLAQAYRAADVTLIPSLGEALSLVALESLACETPLVAFRIGGPAEIIGDDQRGLTADPYNIEMLAQQIQRMLHDAPLRSHLANAGRQWVEEQCDMTRFLDRIEQCYREAIEHFQADAPTP